MKDFLSMVLNNPVARKARRRQARPADAPNEPEFATGEAKPRRRANPTRRAEQSGACGLSRSQAAPRLGRGRAPLPNKPGHADCRDRGASWDLDRGRAPVPNEANPRRAERTQYAAQS